MKHQTDIAKFIAKAGGLQNVIYGDKADGYRVEVEADLGAGTVAFVSTSGKTYPNFGRFNTDMLHLLGRVAQAPEYIGAERHEGEEGIVTMEFEVINKFKPKSDGVTEQIRRKHDVDDSVFQFRAFDVALRGVPYMQRYKLMVELVRGYTDIVVIEHAFLPSYFADDTVNRIEKLVQDGYRLFDREGIVLKDVNGFYEETRSWSHCKVIKEGTHDMKVVGFEEGTGKLKGKVGKFHCLHPDGSGRIVKPGPGKATHDDLEAWFTGAKPLPDIIEVGFKEQYGNGLYRHPRFLCDRWDKSETSVH